MLGHPGLPLLVIFGFACSLFPALHGGLALPEFGCDRARVRILPPPQ